MNKKIVSILLVLNICFTVFSQPNNKTGIAPFKITLLNGKSYSYSQLKKNTETVLIYFSPTCDHCKDFTDELLKRENALKDKQIIMVTYVPVEEIKPFDLLYHISAKPNFKIGTEGYSFIVRKYYNVERFPYVVIYNKQMKLVETLSPAEKPEVLANEIVSVK
jgi:thioredoxin-related protein